MRQAKRIGIDDDGAPDTRPARRRKRTEPKLKPRESDVDPNKLEIARDPSRPIFDRLANYERGDKLIAELARIRAELGDQFQRIEEKRQANLKDLQRVWRGLERREKALKKQGKDKANDDRWKALRKEQEELWAKNERIGPDIRDADRERAYKALEVPTDERIDIVIGNGKPAEGTAEPSAELIAESQRGADWLRRFMRDRKGMFGAEKDLRIGVRDNRGARENAWQETIRVNRGTPRDSIVHEIGHTIEFGREDILSASIEFRDAHFDGKPVIPMNDIGGRWGREEVTRGVAEEFRRLYPSDSGAAYVTKVYEHRGREYASEILAKGIEELERDPFKFAEKSPRYFKYVMAVLDGTVGGDR